MSDETWCNLGVVLKLPILEVEEIKRIIKEKGYHISYITNPTANFIEVVVHTHPSGNQYYYAKH